MNKDVTNRGSWLFQWRRWAGAGVVALSMVCAGAPAVAQQDAPEAAAVEAQPEKGERWIRVVEEDGGEKIKLQLVSREYRLADGAGPSVFLTGAVHVADATFYKELQAFLDAKDVVLFEGVKPPGAGKLDHNAELGNDEALAKATERRIRFVATFVEKHKRTNKAYPATLEELVEGADGRISKILAGCLHDAWGNPLAYKLKDAAPVVEGAAKNKKGSEAFEITSLGADGKPAGDGVDADLAFSDQPALQKGEIVEGEGIQRQLASALRLKFQLDAMDDTKENWRNSDLSVDQVMDRLSASGTDPDQLFSMIGGGSFLDVVIGGLAKVIGSSKMFSTILKMGMVDMLSQADQLLEAMGGEMGTMMEVIIEDRNRIVVDDLARVVRDEPGIKSIGIIYGAGHLPDLERRMAEELKLQPVGEQWFTAITVNVEDTGMSAAEAREMRDMLKSQMKKQLKLMKRGR
jgi:hypothetical protein